MYDLHFGHVLGLFFFGSQSYPQRKHFTGTPAGCFASATLFFILRIDVMMMMMRLSTLITLITNYFQGVHSLSTHPTDPPLPEQYLRMFLTAAVL